MTHDRAEAIHQVALDHDNIDITEPNIQPNNIDITEKIVQPILYRDNMEIVSNVKNSMETIHQGPLDANQPSASCELPSFKQLPHAEYIWSDTMSGADFTQAVTAAYAEVVHWRRNL